MRWRETVWAHGRLEHVGLFTDEKAAARAHGERARQLRDSEVRAEAHSSSASKADVDGAPLLQPVPAKQRDVIMTKMLR